MYDKEKLQIVTFEKLQQLMLVFVIVVAVEFSVNWL